MLKGASPQNHINHGLPENLSAAQAGAQTAVETAPSEQSTAFARCVHAFKQDPNRVGDMETQRESLCSCARYELENCSNVAVALRLARTSVPVFPCGQEKRPLIPGSSNLHVARRHASTFALELLAEKRSTILHRPVVRAIYQIGWRDLPDATAAEWALLHLAEHLLELRHEEGV
jgi:hypothetical protein